MSLQLFANPADVEAIDGEITVVGPNHNGMSLTPVAAEETALALLEQAGAARERHPPRPHEERLRLAAKCRELARLAPEKLHNELLRMAEEFEGDRRS